MQKVFNVDRDTIRKIKPLLGKVSVGILSQAFNDDQRLRVRINSSP